MWELEIKTVFSTQRLKNGIGKMQMDNVVLPEIVIRNDDTE